MPFEYYRRLGPKERRIYRKSDAVAALELDAGRMADVIEAVRATEVALATDSVRAVSKAVSKAD